jgi:hypothetical protein
MNKLRVIEGIIVVLKFILELLTDIADFMTEIITSISSRIDDEEIDENWFLEYEDSVLFENEECTIKFALKYLGEVLLKIISIVYLAAMIIVFGLFYVIFSNPFSFLLSNIINYFVNMLTAIVAFILVVLTIKFLDGGEKGFLDGIDYLKSSGIIEFCKSSIKSVLNI